MDTINCLNTFGNYMSANVYKHAMATAEGNTRDAAVLIAHADSTCDWLLSLDEGAPDATLVWNEADTSNPIIRIAQMGSKYLKLYSESVPAMQAFLESATIRDFYVLWRVVTSPVPVDLGATAVPSQLVRDLAAALGIDGRQDAALLTQLRAKDAELTNLHGAFDQTSAALQEMHVSVSASKSTECRLMQDVQELKEQRTLQRDATDRLVREKDELAKQLADMTARHDAVVTKMVDHEKMQKSMEELRLMFSSGAIKRDLDGQATKKRTRSGESTPSDASE